MHRSTEGTSLPRDVRAQHRALELRFDDLCARAQTDDWRYLDDVWDGFVEDLEEHFSFEEGVLFPALRLVGPEAARVVEGLVADHDRIRNQLEQLGVQIQLHHIRASTIDELVALLRAHAAVENEHLYGWAERRAAEPGARER